MTGIPVYEGDTLTGHRVSLPPAYIPVYDARGYKSLLMILPARMGFVPIDRQLGMFDDED
ncbi:hypothetical protein PQR05_29815 [Paraburkholderia sediminicola]|uniref:hypothetical protein n=1 Tax=Paraburkholderia sediminicola TaxID=458836 RepID=UPI0038BA48CF